MFLYINGQDIRKIVLGVYEKDGWKVEAFESQPERFLRAIDEFLKAKKMKKKDVNKIYCIMGPGSATALRAALSIVNAWKFVDAIEIVGLEKDSKMNDETFLNTKLEQVEKGLEQEKYLEPIYEHGPRITLTNKDRLKRQKTIK